MKRGLFLSSVTAAGALAFLRQSALAESISGTADMRPLLETLIPFGSPGFPPVSAGDIAIRIEALYHLNESPQFQATLAAFLRPGEYSEGNAALYAIERLSVPGATPAHLIERDRSSYRNSGLPVRASFAGFDSAERGRYVELWARSAFNTRRRFYQSMRFLTFAAFYSMPEVWPSIDYAGPLLETTQR